MQQRNCISYAVRAEMLEARDKVGAYSSLVRKYKRLKHGGGQAYDCSSD
jgi:hypothetical protein